MKIKELKQKNEKELNDFLKQTKQKLGALKFSLAGKKTKNVKEAKELRRDIARTLTLLHNKTAQRPKNGGAKV